MQMFGGAITLTAKVEGLDGMIARMDAGLFTIAALSRTVTKYAKLVQAQAIANVSGNQVTYSGGVFVINRVTGKLAQSITVLQPNPLSAIVRATAEYADYVEGGTREFDMKPGLMGKIVPIRATGIGKGHNAQLGQIGGMSTLGPVKGGVSKITKRNSKGRISKYEYISFRKVTAKSTGWIRPAMPARPFMLAAAERLTPLFEAEVANVVATYIQGTSAA